MAAIELQKRLSELNEADAQKVQEVIEQLKTARSVVKPSLVSRQV